MTTDTDRFTLSAVQTVQKAHANLGKNNAAEMLLEIERFARVAEHYPSYFIVRGEYLIALGRFEEARESLKHALKLSPNSARPALLLESLYGIEKQVALPTVEQASVTRPLKKNATLAGLFGESDVRIRPAPRKAAALAASRSNFDLGEIASLLSRERPLVRPTSDHPEQQTQSAAPSATHSFVSETLAGILLGQGKLKEALEAYEHLLVNEPERSEYYRERIGIIQKRIRSST